MYKSMVLILLFISVIFSTQLYAGEMMDEFSSIYHSDAIIEVVVSLDKYNHPKECYYLRTIKGDKKMLAEISKTFKLSTGKKSNNAKQKRLMYFYRNGNSALRTMDLVREGEGPYSDNKYYGDFVKMVSYVDRLLKGSPVVKDGMILIDDAGVCKTLKNNKYVRRRYSYVLDGDDFTLGGYAGAFADKFSPVVKIECKSKE